MDILWEGTVEGGLFRLVLVDKDSEDADVVILQQSEDEFGIRYWSRSPNRKHMKLVLIEFMKVAKDYVPRTW